MNALHLYARLWSVVVIGLGSYACGELPRMQGARAPLHSAFVATAAETSAHTRPAAEVSQVPEYFTRLIERAQALAAAPDRTEPRPPLPDVLRDLDYQAYSSIRFRPERSLWRGEPGNFEAQFFHLGSYYKEPVRVFVVQPGSRHAESVPFSTDLFSYEHAPKPPNEAALGFAGLRLHAAINDPSRRDEMMVFQGASYFRAVARNEVYGLSARGLAIDTGAASGEEFPRFSELYLVRPQAGDTHAWVLALLESRRATGAYAFRIVPGEETVIDVEAHVFLREREPIKTLGIAPLTSMFLFGEATPARFGGFRPEVHDSDTAALWARSGERIVRPLRNPDRTTLATFRLDSPRGFGLLQRDRSFDSYQDFESRYQDRPSLWIEPLDDWGPGSAQLLEISTKLETDDNVVLAWVPDATPRGGATFRYRMHVGAAPEREPAAGRVLATRLLPTPRGMRFLVDFAEAGAGSAPNEAKLVLDASAAQIVEQHVEANPFAHALRASFELEPKPGAKEVELRAFLRGADDVSTETWSYLWQPTP